MEYKKSCITKRTFTCFISAYNVADRDKQGGDVVCAYNQTFVHVGSEYEHDMRCILMRIVIFSPQNTQKQAPSPCYSMLINDVSGLLWSNIRLVHVACLKFMWGTDRSWLRAISWPCTQSPETWKLQQASHHSNSSWSVEADYG